MPYALIRKLNLLMASLPTPSDTDKDKSILSSSMPLTDDHLRMLERIEESATNTFGNDHPPLRAKDIMEAHGYAIKMEESKSIKGMVPTIITEKGKIPYR